MNAAKCGINGNCICPRFFYGQRCETQISSTKKVIFKEKGIGQGNVFIICFLFLVVLPLVLYAMAACLMRCLSENQEDELWAHTFSDAFFCFKWIKCPAIEVRAP